METKSLPYQLEFFKKLTVSGIKPGELTVMMAGRRTGKSMYIGKLLQEWSDSHNPSKLVLGEGTAFGVKYHLAEPVGMDWVAILKWSTETFGEMSHVKDGDKGRWYINNRTLYFRNLKDRDWFVLRWNS